MKEIKNQFKQCKLGDFVEVQSGFAFKSSDFSDYGIPVIKISNIVPPRVLLDEVTFFNKLFDKKLNQYLVKKGDILISMTGSTVNQMPSAVGKIGRYQFDEPALINQRVGKIYVTDKEKLDGNFLFFLLIRDDVQYDLALNATGSANQANISPAQIKDIDILLPPLPIQRRIAEILGALDDKIECNRRINKTLEQMAMTLYKQWFVDFGPFRDSEFVESELGPIPRGWAVGKLGETCHLLMGQSPPSKFYNELGEGLPFHQGVTNFGWRFPKHVTSCIDLARIADVGSILLSVRAPVGRINIANWRIVIGRGLASINHIRGWNSFLLYQLKSVFTKEDALGSGTIFNAITKPDLEKIKVIIPPNNIIEEFDVTVSTYDKQIFANEHESDILAHNRDYLLPKLISGEIQFKDADEFLNRRI